MTSRDEVLRERSMPFAVELAVCVALAVQANGRREGGCDLRFAHAAGWVSRCCLCVVVWVQQVVAKAERESRMQSQDKV